MPVVLVAVTTVKERQNHGGSLSLHPINKPRRAVLAKKPKTVVATQIIGTKQLG